MAVPNDPDPKTHTLRALRFGDRKKGAVTAWVTTPLGTLRRPDGGTPRPAKTAAGAGARGAFPPLSGPRQRHPGRSGGCGPRCGREAACPPPCGSTRPVPEVVHQARAHVVHIDEQAPAHAAHLLGLEGEVDMDARSTLEASKATRDRLAHDAAADAERFIIAGEGACAGEWRVLPATLSVRLGAGRVNPAFRPKLQGRVRVSGKERHRRRCSGQLDVSGSPWNCHSAGASSSARIAARGSDRQSGVRRCQPAVLTLDRSLSR